MCPCIFSIIVNDDQQDATILAYLFIPNELYMFRATSSPIIRSTMHGHTNVKFINAKQAKGMYFYRNIKSAPDDG